MTTESEDIARAKDEIVRAAEGLSFGEDWNGGTHAITHGYREALTEGVRNLAVLRAALKAVESKT